MKVQNFLRLVSVMLCLLAWCVPVWAQQLIWLNPLESTSETTASDVVVVNNEPVVVGTAGFHAPSGIVVNRAFRWKPSTGMEDLGGLCSYCDSRAAAISLDGRFIVGIGDDENGQGWVVQWSQDSGMRNLGFSADPAAVSLDGSVIVGTVDSSGNRAFRWTATAGMQILGSTTGSAIDVSADGSIVVGTLAYSNDAGSGYYAFRWSAERGIEDLNVHYPPPSTFPPSLLVEAHAISPDGRFIAGIGFYADGSPSQPFLIDTQTGTTRWLELPPPSGNLDFAYGDVRDISADGSIVVGVAYDPTWIRGRAYRWRRGQGGEDLNVTYAALLSPGSVLYTATAISADGRYIVGSGYNAERGRVEPYLLDTGTSTAVEEEKPTALPSLSLWPNPFRDVSHVRFQLPMSGPVRVVVYDLLGRPVRVLADGLLPAGVHEVIWDGRSDAGVRLPAGVYLLQLQVGEKVQSQRITLLR